MCIFATLQQLQITKHLLLQGNQYTSQQFLISDGVCLELIRYHIVDILDKNDVSIEVVKILNQGSMTTRTEEQLAIYAERLVVLIGCDGIGRALLL